MAVKLNAHSYEHAQQFIRERKVVLDERDNWSEHQPNAEQEDRFIREQGFREYELWHLAVDDTHAKHTKGRYKFPYGDFRDVHRCAVLAVESRAGQYKYADIERAAAHLHGMLEALRSESPKMPPPTPTT